jgi:hypothetical protein
MAYRAPMRQVQVSRTLADAYLARDYLASEGLRPEIRNEHLVGTQGGLPLTADTLPTVWVPDEEAARAADLLREHRETGGIAAQVGLEDPPDSGADPRAQAAMSELYLAADRLRRTVTGEQVDAARGLAQVITGSSPPFGIEAAQWQHIGAVTRRMIADADAADTDAARTAAAELSDLLRPLV